LNLGADKNLTSIAIACVLVRQASANAYSKVGRSLVAPDVINELP